MTENLDENTSDALKNGLRRSSDNCKYKVIQLDSWCVEPEIDALARRGRSKGARGEGNFTCSEQADSYGRDLNKRLEKSPRLTNTRRE